MNVRFRFTLLAGTLLLAGCTSPDEPAAPAAFDGDTLVRLLQATTADWNRGDLEGFIAPYDSASTFMSAGGPVGRDRMYERYRQRYFTGSEPDQQLRFEDVHTRPLGQAHALMTGRYVLTGGDQPDRSGWFSLVWVHRPDGWKILHDHSS